MNDFITVWEEYMFKSIFSRLFWTYAAILALVLSSVALSVGVYSNHFVVAQHVKNVKGVAETIEYWTAASEIEDSSARAKTSYRNLLREWAEFLHADIIITNTEGRAIAATGSVSTVPDTLLNSVITGNTVQETSTFNGAYKTDVLIVGIPVHYQGGVVGAMFFNTPMYNLKRTTGELFSMLAICALIAMLAAGVLVFIQSRRISRQITEINKASLKKWPNSYTVKYLLHQEEIPVPKSRRPWNRFIEIKGARMNNLKGMDIKIPLNVMTVVTGVSGSGKSSLIKGILYPAMRRRIGEACDAPGEYLGFEGDMDAIKHIEFVDQNPIGKSTRSNPATYVKAYDAIRDLYADQPLSKQMGFTPQYFSFNADGGRCEECKGAGVITVEMQFMADLVLECEACHGHRFKKEILDVNYHGKNVDDVLNMTIAEAIVFFEEHNEATIVKRLKTLDDVGLGYIKLGQNSSSLSGGENQRVKLAYFIGQEKQEPTLFIFDEPTTGLHFHDIQRLLKAFDALIARGHTILIIEHNMEVIKCADHVIDLGPNGGDKGGNLVVAGPPEIVAACKESLTGKYLKEKLE